MGCVRLHFKEVVLIFPNERHIFEFLEIVLLLTHYRALSAASRCAIHLISKEEVIDELFPPLDDALHNVQREHSEAVHDVEAFVKKLVVVLLVLGCDLLNSKTVHLHVLFVCFSKYFFKLHNLRDTAFTCYDRSDRLLNWSRFVLEIFYFFDYDW